jgi:hypothetical protein
MRRNEIDPYDGRERIPTDKWLLEDLKDSMQNFGLSFLTFGVIFLSLAAAAPGDVAWVSVFFAVVEGAGAAWALISVRSGAPAETVRVGRTHARRWVDGLRLISWRFGLYSVFASLVLLATDLIHRLDHSASSSTLFTASLAALVVSFGMTCAITIATWRSRD